MFDDFDTQIHPEETKECWEYDVERELERTEETSNEELASDIEWDAHWAEFDSVLDDLCG
jgi:hypothetical protein